MKDIKQSFGTKTKKMHQYLMVFSLSASPLFAMANTSQAVASPMQTLPKYGAIYPTIINSKETDFGQLGQDVLGGQPTKSPAMSAGVRFNERYINAQIAQWSYRQVNATLPVLDDPWVNQTVFTITAQMNALVRNQSLFAVSIINDKQINAFAVPGGLIGINTGTITASQGLDEMASVLAHEIAHLSQRHYEHNLDNSKKLLALQIGGLLAAIAASAVSGDAAAAAMMGSQAATAETAASHSREHEREADRIGQQILVQAGYDAAAMPRFFSRLYKQVSLSQDKNAFIPSFVKSHPFTAERLSESTSRASSYPPVSMAKKAMQDDVFDKLLWRVRYLTKQTGYDELAANAKTSKGAKLALVAYLTDNYRYKEALQLLNNSVFDRNDPLVCITHAKLYAAQTKYEDAQKILKSCHDIYPERKDLIYHLAEVYAWSSQQKRAISILEPLVKSNPQDLNAWRGLLLAYEKSAPTSNPTEKAEISIGALRARSQIEMWQGKYLGALQSNAQAQKIAKDANLSVMLERLEADKKTIIAARDYKP